MLAAVERAPFVSGMQLQKEGRAIKLLLYGEAKVGKTSFVLSTFPYLEALGVKPTDVRVYLLDCDDGTKPLLDRGVVKPDWLDSIRYVRSNTFDDVMFYTEQALPDLLAWAQSHGPRSAWLVIDNMKSAWQWTREKFARDIYGMPEHELQLQRRLEAQSQGKKMLPTFNQLTDYAVINPLHNNWIDKIKVSGVNFILTAPEDSYTPRNKDGTEGVTVIKPGGQKENGYRVDDIMRLYTERVLDKGSADYGKVKYFADLEGSRTAKVFFHRAPDPTMEKFMGFVEKNRGA